MRSRAPHSSSCRLSPRSGWAYSRHGQRGSTFIVVLAILSLLVLVATALSLTSRLEVVSAANYAEGIQARMAAKVGIALAAGRSVLPPPVNRGSTPGAVSVPGMAAIATQAVRASTSTSSDRSLVTDGVVDLRALAVVQNVSVADVWTQDASARVNLNTATEQTLLRLLQSVAERAHVTDGDPAGLARAIILYRQGSDEGKPPDIRQMIDQTARLRRLEEATAPDRGIPDPPLLKGVTPPDPRRVDLRVAPLDQEQRFTSVMELLRLPGASPSLVGAAAPYLTVFSSSKRYADLSQGSRGLVDLNTADTQQIYSALQSLYPEGTKRDRLLKQFAANIVDSRDSDRIPTAFPGEDATDPILGLERTSFLTEVWPNSIYPEETDGAGQYVEIYNPWSDPIDVTGWSLSIAGTTVPLRGLIQSGGYLIVTDVFDGLDPGGKKVQGPFDSFYSIFSAVGNGVGRRILEDQRLQLPWMEGIHTVRLLDAQGNLIDVFVYAIRTPLRGQKTSYQRLDPRLRVAVAAPCSPFAPIPRTVPFVENPDSQDAPAPLDRPFLATTELFYVYAGWGMTITGEEVSSYPVLATPGSPDAALSREAASDTRVDGRVLDVFAVKEPTLWKIALGQSPEPKPLAATGEVASKIGLGTTVANQRQERVVPGSAGSAMAVAQALENLKEALDSPELRRRLDRAVSENDEVTVASLAQRGFLQLGEDTVLGAVNLNTAPRVVLGSLPGLDDTIAAQWAQEREKRQSRLHLGESVILFRCPSDLLADPAFWRADARPEQRLGRLTSLLGVVTFSTSSVFLDSHTAVGQQAGSAGRRPTVSRALALVAFDRGRPEFVAWSQLP